MARNRSARKSAVPLRTPRRKRSPLPASLRISAPSLSIRLAICFSLNAFLIFFLNGNLVDLSSLAHLERLGDLHARQEDDLSTPQHERNSVAGLARDFTINQEILQLFRLWHAEGLETVAVAAVADGELGPRILRELESLPVAGCRSADSDRCVDFGDVSRITRPQFDLELVDRLRFSSQDPFALSPQKLEVAGHADALDRIELRGEAL